MRNIQLLGADISESRMHSSRMRTVRNSSRLARGGVSAPRGCLLGGVPAGGVPAGGVPAGGVWNPSIH